jgi:hypothetical protein
VKQKEEATTEKHEMMQALLAACFMLVSFTLQT